MKVAANVVAVVAWLGFLAAMWWPLLTGVTPPLGAWITATIFSLLVAFVVPGFLINLEDRLAARPEGQRGRKA